MRWKSSDQQSKTILINYNCHFSFYYSFEFIRSCYHIILYSCYIPLTITNKVDTRCLRWKSQRINITSFLLCWSLSVIDAYTQHKQCHLFAKNGPNHCLAKWWSVWNGNIWWPSQPQGSIFGVHLNLSSARFWHNRPRRWAVQGNYNKTLPKHTGHLTDSNFLNRVLFMNMYWFCYLYTFVFCPCVAFASRSNV